MYQDDVRRIEELEQTAKQSSKPVSPEEAEVASLAEKWFTNDNLEDIVAGYEAIRLRQNINRVKFVLREFDITEAPTDLRAFVDSLPNGELVSNAVLSLLKAERDARIRSEEAEAVKVRTERERNEAEEASRRTQEAIRDKIELAKARWSQFRTYSAANLVASIPEIPAERSSAFNAALDAWRNALRAEADGNAVLDAVAESQQPSGGSFRAALEGVRNQIEVRRSEYRASTESAARLVEKALNEIREWADDFVRANTPTDENAEKAEQAAAAARNDWERAKTATDAAIAKEEETEKRRAEERREFHRLYERVELEIQSCLADVRALPGTTPNLSRQVVALKSALVDWKNEKKPLDIDLSTESKFAEELEARAESMKTNARRLVCAVADRLSEKARLCLENEQLDEAIAMANRSLRWNASPDVIQGLIDQAEEAKKTRENEIHPDSDSVQCAKRAAEEAEEHLRKGFYVQARDGFRRAGSYKDELVNLGNADRERESDLRE